MFLNKSYFQLFTICVLALSQAPVVLSSKDARIIGGEPTTIDREPYIAQILYYGQHFCGGSIVSEHHIVTAAHCAIDKLIQYLTVIAGTDQVYGAGAWSRVEKIIMPQSYNRRTFHMDVAVLKLTSALVGRNIRPIGLCTQDWHDGAQVKVSGWGLTSENPRLSTNQLRTVNLITISTDVCTYLFGKYATITDAMLCASGQGGKDACQGDSGGPAVINGELCGIVSFGIGCGRPDFPGVYTNVNAVKPFITTAVTM